MKTNHLPEVFLLPDHKNPKLLAHFRVKTGKSTWKIVFQMVWDDNKKLVYGKPKTRGEEASRGG